MRAVAMENLVRKHGEATRATLPHFTREIQRLDALWKRDRAEFEKEANTWVQ